MKLMQIRVDQQDQLPQYVRRIWARKNSSLITKLEEYKKICRELAAKQKEDFESAKLSVDERMPAQKSYILQ